MIRQSNIIYMPGKFIKPSDPGAYAGETQIIGSVYLEWGNLERLKNI